MKYFGDFNKGTTVLLPFNTNDGAGASVTIATNGTLKAYIGSSTTETTAGLTLLEDFDGITGRHFVSIDTGNAAYPIGSEVSVALDGAVVDGVTVNVFIGSFSVNRNNALQPYSGLVATATSTSQLTLPSVVPGVADVLVGMLFVPVHGTGAGQTARFISANTSGRVITLDPPLTTAVGTDTSFLLIRTAPSPINAVDRVDLRKINGVTITGTGVTPTKFNVV